MHSLCLQNSGPFRAALGEAPKAAPRRRLQPLQGPQQASCSVQGLLKVLVSLLGREHSHGARPSAKSLALPSGPCSESR